MLNIAAIDMGSNAIRMMVGRLTLEGRPETLDNLRLPVRLGQDAFTVGRFSEETMQSAVDAFLRLRDVARTFGVSKTRAVATSAMREAANGPELVARLGRKTGFGIEIIAERRPGSSTWPSRGPWTSAACHASTSARVA
jgi:exopolyphosphatase/guanosine-5'-triphosphate,3'-diphosphate pyrophosphatase